MIVSERVRLLGWKVDVIFLLTVKDGVTVLAGGRGRVLVEAADLVPVLEEVAVMGGASNVGVSLGFNVNVEFREYVREGVGNFPRVWVLGIDLVNRADSDDVTRILLVVGSDFVARAVFVVVTMSDFVCL